MTAPRRLISPGPVADAFGQSRAFICGIVGPVGSGKTMAALQKGLRVAAMQGGQVDAQGVTWRKARVGVIRESYPSLQSTTLKSWFNVVPETEGKFGWRAPFTHTFQKILRRAPTRPGEGKGKPIDILKCEYEFRAIGDQTVEEACRGWEVNAVLVDEADLQPEDLVPFLTGRVGRFSDLSPELVVDPQIILSLNMPDIDNHIYRLLFDKDLGLSEEDQRDLASALNGRPLIEGFVQPGGRDAKAENLHNLPGGRGYYVLQVAANKHKPGYVDRMVDNKPVPLQHGQPVNADFSFTDHVRPLEWDRRRKLILGIDQGLFAAAVALQRTGDGAIRTLAEVVNLAEGGKALRKVGPTAFGQRVKRMLTERFPELGSDQVRVVADPAAFAASDREDSEQDWLLAFQKALGLKVHRAKSNKQALRNEAIWRAQAQRDGYAVDPSAKHLIKAHLGGYRYQKATLATGETRGHLEIADTIYTHVADAEQYAALEGEHVIADIRGRERRRAPVRVDADYDVLGGRY
jgi:RecA/RadA recombinase